MRPVRQRPWLVLHVRDFRKAAENVRNQGAEWYAPFARLRSERTRLLTVRPLFPGYAFARPRTRAWVFLRSTRGVAGVLMRTEEAPAWCPHVEIARLRAREGPDGLVRLNAEEFRVGERVRVEKGYGSFDAIVDGMAGQERVFVLLQVLGGGRAEVSVRDVWRA